jgi:hypothetical protein
MLALNFRARGGTPQIVLSFHGGLTEPVEDTAVDPGPLEQEPLQVVLHPHGRAVPHLPRPGQRKNILRGVRRCSEGAAQLR